MKQVVKSFRPRLSSIRITAITSTNMTTLVLEPMKQTKVLATPKRA